MRITNMSLCECGHSLEFHHDSMVCDGLVYEEWQDVAPQAVPFDPSRHKKGEIVSINTAWWCLENNRIFPHAHGAECEFYGVNETGGLMPGTEENSWVQHCRTFRLRQ